MMDGRGRNRFDRDSNKDSKYDDPPHSRLFIVCGKHITEEDFRNTFSAFGTIEEVWMVKDRITEEPKGVTYIKFSKTSEAALAMEEMNGKCIGNHLRPLKVLIAHSREQGSRRDTNEEQRLLRLFVVVPKTMIEVELRAHFEQFGDIDYVSIVKDRSTKESKGFAYVKYHRMSHSAKAYENCDSIFKPVFADPKPQKEEKNIPYRVNSDARDNYYDKILSMDVTRRDVYGLTLPTVDPPTAEGATRLTVYASPQLNQDQLWKLFDLIPGLDYCDLRKDSKVGQGRAMATVVYNNMQSANYAKEKLHGFEYPPGQRLIVKNDIINEHVPAMCTNFPRAAQGVNGTGQNTTMVPQTNGRSPNIQQDLAAQLAETIAQATSLIQAAASGTNNVISAPPPTTTNGTDNYDPYLCNIRLPPPQPLAPVDSPVAQRLFIVCHTAPPPIYVLKDVFGRFGNLIDVYILAGKTFGYAKYASRESATKAINSLHCQEVMGVRLKVMEADPQDKSESSRKRIRVDD